jgi:F420H(2)-dependent quinone reductase
VDSTFNQIAEAIVRAGIGGPCCVGLGLVIVETKGRKTGVERCVPVLANRVGNSLFVSTVRENSQWVRNLKADPNPHVLLNRESRSVTVRTKKIGTWTVLRLELGAAA